MISDKFAASQIARCADLRRAAAPTDAGLLELVKALQEAATSETEAKAIIDHYIRENVWAPTPADLYAIRRMFAAREGPKPECDTCYGTGFTPGESAGGSIVAVRCQSCRGTGRRE